MSLSVMSTSGLSHLLRCPLPLLLHKHTLPELLQLKILDWGGHILPTLFSSELSVALDLLYKSCCIHINYILNILYKCI